MLSTCIASFKRNMAVASALLLITAGAPAVAHAQLTIAGGLNFQNLEDIDTGSTQATIENSTGYHVGLYYNLGAGSFSIRPGVFIRNIQSIKATALSLRDDFSLNMVDVPVDVRFRVGSGSPIAPSLSVGPVVHFANSSDEGFDSALDNLSLSASAGAGLEFRMPVLGLKLFPEIRYSFGLTGFTKDGEPITIAGQDFTVANPSNLNTIMLRLGIGN